MLQDQEKTLLQSVEFIDPSRDLCHRSASWVYLLRSIYFAKIIYIFLAFLTIHTNRNRCGQIETSPCYSKSQSLVCIPSFRSVAPRVCL